MIFTIIGNRDAPVYERDKYVPVVKALLLAGHIGRSGGAVCMDDVLTQAVKELLAEGHTDIKAEIYLPKKYFNGLVFGDLGGRVVSVLEFNNRSEAMELASKFHAAWHYCDEWSRGLHARNMYEIKGRELNTPADFVLTYAKTNRNGVIMRGTATAAALATSLNIPIFNSYVTPFDGVYAFLKEQGIDHVNMDHRE